MALTTTQVNQAFLGLLGRPATGAEAAKFAGQLDAATLAQTLLTDASFKNELSVETLSFKTVDLLNTDPAAFVESLYTALLGRASDAEGKAFWLSVAGATPNRADVVAQFIAAVKAQEGTADANAFASIQAEDKALASAWVESLYNNLAGRASDAEGLDFWTNAIVSFTMTPAQVAASFAAALALQGNTTEDGQNFAAKLGVADNFTANFKDFNALITANEKAEQLKNLVTMMNGVNKDSQVDQYVEEITKVGNEYQNIAAVQFTKADDDNLGIDPETGESNLKGAANFTGTYNLTDATKGTIQSSDSATGTEAYLTDTLTINVTGYDKTTHDTFNLSELPSTTSIEKLSINNGAATVSGSISGDFEYINVNGTGSFNIDATTSNADGFKDIVLNSAANKDGSNSFATAQNAVSIKAGAGNDNIDLRIDATTAATIAKSLSTGAGKDNVVANIGKDATADLGAGDDTFSGFLGQAAKLNAGAGDDLLAVWGAGYRSDNNKNPIAEVEIDGGTGTDTLDLTRGLIDGILGQQNTDYLGVKSIKGIEKMIVGNGTTLYANAISGQKIELSGTSLVLNASGASTIDLTKLSNAKDEDVAVRITNVKNGSISLETGNKNFNAIKETIELSSEATKVSVKGFEKGNDHVAIENATATADELFTHSTAGTTTGINTNLVNANEIFFVSLKEKITKNDLNKLLDTATFSNLTEKDVFYVVATDSAEVYGGTGKNSTAKIYKIEVGKDLKVGKLDQMATVNVADKAQLSAQDFGAGTPTPVPSETVDTKDYPVTSGELDLSTVVMSDPNKSYAVELGTNPDVASITSVKLPAGINATEVTIVDSSTTAKPAGAVAVSVPADATITTLKLGSTADTTTQYNVTVAANAQISAIVTNNADNKIDISALPAGTVTVVNAGDGIDTLTIGGEAAAADGFSMTGVEKLAYTGTTINSDAIFANAEPNKTLELINESGNANKKLIVKAGTANDGNVDLSSLVNTEVAGKAAAIEVTGVASGKTVTLSSGTAAKAITETVTLGAATNVTIANAAKGDNISSDNFAATVVGNGGNFENLTGDIANTKAYFVDPATAATVTDFATAKATFSEKLAAFTSGDAIIAVNGANEKVYVFAIKGATGGATATEVAIVNGKFDNSYGIKNGTITIADTAPEPQPTSGELQAVLIDQTTDYELTVVNPPVSVDEAGTVLKLASDKVTALKAAGAKYLTVDATSEKAATLSFDAAVKNSNAIEIVDLKGTGDRTVNLANVNATAVKNIKDGAANTTLDISGKTFDTTVDADKFAKGLNIDLGAGTDVVNIGKQTHASGAFTLTGVEGIKASGGTLDADLVTKVASGAVTTDLTQIEGSLTLQKFAAATTSIDLSNITKATGATEAKLTLDLVSGTPVAAANLTSVKGTAANDTLVVSGGYTKLTTLDSIETLSLSGDTTLKAAAITGDTLVISSGGSNKLTVDASGADTLDLANLSKGAGDPTIEITNVGQGTTSGATITLNATDAIAETITFASGVTSVTVKNAKSGEDKLNLQGITKITATSGWDAGWANGKAQFATTTVSVDNLNKDAVAELFKGATSASSGQKMQVYIKGTDGIAVYDVTGGAGTVTIGDNAVLTLYGAQTLVQTDIAFA